MARHVYSRSARAAVRIGPWNALGHVDRALSEAQNFLSAAVNAETKEAAPGLYKFGDELYNEIEKMRRRIVSRKR